MEPALRKAGKPAYLHTVPIPVYPAWLQLIKHLPQQFPLQICLLQHVALTVCYRLFPNLPPFAYDSPSLLFGHVARNDTVLPLTPCCYLLWDRSWSSQNTAPVTTMSSMEGLEGSGSLRYNTQVILTPAFTADVLNIYYLKIIHTFHIFNAVFWHKERATAKNIKHFESFAVTLSNIISK